MQVLAELLVRGGNVIPETTILIVVSGMLVLAAVDVWRQEVDDYAVLVLLAVAVIGFCIEGVPLQQWFGAVAAAAVAFVIYLNLGQRGVMGGGDVKLSVVPAFALGAANPLLGVWWIGCAIIIHYMLALAIGWIRHSREALPHVPAMTAATMVSAAALPGIIHVTASYI